MSDEEKKDEEPQIVPHAAPSAEEQKSVETQHEEKHDKKKAKKESKAEKAKMPPKSIDVREYSKAVLLYPLFLYSLIGYIIMKIADPTNTNANGVGGYVGFIWIMIFFTNLFVIAFNFPTAKFFILFLILVVVILVVILLYIAGLIPLTNASALFDELLKVYMNSTFYSTLSILLAIVLIFVLISARMKFIHIEENEVFIKHVMMGKEERYSTQSMKYMKEIPDIFEFLVLGAGSMTFTFGQNVTFTIDTIPMVNKIAEKIDMMGDFLQVRIGGKK